MDNGGDMVGHLMEAAEKASNHPNHQVQEGLTVLRRDLRSLGPASPSVCRGKATTQAGAGQAQHLLHVKDGFVTLCL